MTSNVNRIFLNLCIVRINKKHAFIAYVQEASASISFTYKLCEFNEQMRAISNNQNSRPLLPYATLKEYHHRVCYSVDCFLRLCIAIVRYLSLPHIGG